MKKIRALVEESIWDYIKDHVKDIISSLAVIFIASLTAFIKQVNSVELKIKLPIIIVLIIILLVAVINVWRLLKKYSILKKEYDKLLNPPNENVKKFSLGDTVILKLDEESQNPNKMIVFKIYNSEIACRNVNGVEKKYIPEELLTADETRMILRKIELEKQRNRNAQNDIINTLGSFYRVD